jgi:hypothetical protein
MADLNLANVSLIKLLLSFFVALSQLLVSVGLIGQYFFGTAEFFSAREGQERPPSAAQAAGCDPCANVDQHVPVSSQEGKSANCDATRIRYKVFGSSSEAAGIPQSEVSLVNPWNLWSRTEEEIDEERLQLSPEETARIQAMLVGGGPLILTPAGLQ